MLRRRAAKGNQYEVRWIGAFGNSHLTNRRRHVGVLHRAAREQARVGGWDHNLEALVGGRAIAFRAAEILGDGAKPADLFDAARAGKPQAASDWLAETQEYLAMATASVIALLDPDAVVFGGGVIAAQGAWFLDPIRELAHRSTPTKTPIVPSQLGEDAQILGAIKLALDKEGVVRA